MLYIEGDIWCATSYGLYRLNLTNNTLYLYTTLDGLSENSINNIYYASDGSIWIATKSGMSRYKDGAFISYGDEESIATHNVNFIIEDTEGGIWVDSHKGLSRFDGERWTDFSVNDGLPSSIILALFSGTNGTVWVSTREGIASYKNDTWQTYEIPGYGTDVTVRQFAEDNNSIPWAIIEDQLAFLSDTGWQFFHTEYEHVRVMLFDHENNLCFLDRGYVVMYHESKFIDLTDIIGWLGDEGYDNLLLDNQGNIWFYSEKYIIRFDGISFTFFFYEQSNNIHSILIGPDGVLWIGSYKGITAMRDDVPLHVKSDFEEHPSTLNSAYPNPFNTTTTISYQLAYPSLVQLSVYGISGQKVATLVNDYKNAGIHNIRFNGSNLPSGVYFYRIETPDFTATDKMLLVK
jgi:ligand-binding sensor domain-containing protein